MSTMSPLWYGRLPTVKVLELFCNVRIWIDLLKRVVGLQAEELAKLVQ